MSLRGLIVNEQCRIRVEVEGRAVSEWSLWGLLRAISYLHAMPTGAALPGAIVTLQIGDEVYEVTRPITDDLGDWDDD